MIKRKCWIWIKNNNECCIKLFINTKRWYLLWGIDYRESIVIIGGGTDYYLNIGFLCFSISYTKYKGLSPYTKSCFKGKAHEKDNVCKFN